MANRRVTAQNYKARDEATEVAAKHAAEVFLTEADNKDGCLFVASGFEAIDTKPP